jgi:hypothetical protein
LDTTTLRDLARTHGPFASVYFDDTHNTEDAAKQRELTWRELREELADQGADEGTLTALDEVVLDREPPVGRAGRAVVAAAEQVLLDQRLTEPPPRPVARVSRLPYVVPLVQHGELPPAHVVAVVDRVGADVTAVDEHGTVVDSRTVEGPNSQVHKVRGGAWSHRNLQARAEELARQNIEQAAEHVASIARRVGAALVVVAGDAQARRTLIEALPQQVRETVEEVEPGGRKQGSGNDELDALVDDLLAEAVRRRTEDVVRRFSAAFAQPTGLAVQGLEAVTTALREGNVSTLLVGEPGDAEVLVGSDPSLVALQKELLGDGEATRVRADEALPMAAAAVNADVVGVGDQAQLSEGFGAVLRHD